MKNLQRLSGIDGDYDNESGSGSDRIARRRTVFNLEKASKKRRQIGTLDVAFKKRFMKLTSATSAAGSEPNGPNGGHSNAAPMLPSRMVMRSETIRALEVRKNSIMAERHKSSMQTLGANSPALAAANPNGVSTNVTNHSNQIGYLRDSYANRQANELPVRNGRSSNAGINIQTVFNPNGGLSTGSEIYGHTSAAGVAAAAGRHAGPSQLNGAYEADSSDDRNSMRLNPRNQSTQWSNRL